MLRRAAGVIALALMSCRGEDLGFDVVKVPKTAYEALPDADVSGDGGVTVAVDAGRGPIVLCVPEPEDDPDEDADVSEEFARCLIHQEGRTFDKRATERHRNNGDAGDVCCYRRR